MAYTTIDKPTDYFNTKLYTGNGSSNALTGIGHQPDFVWIKVRNYDSSHALFDAVRGGTKRLYSDTTGAEVNYSDGIQSFDTDGFTLGSGGAVNDNSYNFASWNWKAGGSAPAITYSVKVVSDSGNKYRFDDFGTSAVTLDLQEGGTYTFDQSDSSNSGHPLRFSTTSNGTHGGGSEYTTGVTVTGTPGNSGAKTVITVAASAPTLYYYCTQHSAMGGQANTNSLFGSSNFSGTIQSTVSAGNTQGFSIATWTGNATSSQSVGHGLNSVPKAIFTKNTDNGSQPYKCYFSGVGNAAYLQLNSTGAASISGVWSSTTPTSSIINISNDTGINGSGNTIIGYNFTNVKGYQHIGSYSGNGNDIFIYTGFKVGWLLVKVHDGTNGWLIIDAKRSPANPQGKYIYANSHSAEGTVTYGEFFSNGFGWKGTNSIAVNQSGKNYVYIAIAENPYVTSSGVPATAR
jgi:hypothetical protein